jgi:hypothetical protein
MIKGNLGWHRIFAAALITAGAGAHAQVDLTPVTWNHEFDGAKVSCVIFRDGKQKLTYTPPNGWQLSGSGQKLSLSSDIESNAEAQINVKPSPAAAPIDQASVQQYVLSSQQSAPAGSRNLQVLSSKLSPLKICGYETLAIELKYEAFGTTYRSHFLYLNRDRDQWTFRFTSPMNTFDRAFEPFRVSLYSLTGL